MVSSTAGFSPHQSGLRSATMRLPPGSMVRIRTGPAVADAVRQAGFGPGAPAALRFVRNVSHAAREEFVAATT